MILDSLIVAKLFISCLSDSGHIDNTDANFCAKIDNSLSVVACSGNVTLASGVIVVGLSSYDRSDKDGSCALFLGNLYVVFIKMPSEGSLVGVGKRSIGESTVALIDDICRDLKLNPYEVMRDCEQYAPLSKKVSALKAAAEMFGELIAMVDEVPLDELLDAVLTKTGYLNYLKNQENGESKIENVEELRTSVIRYME